MLPGEPTISDYPAFLQEDGRLRCVVIGCSEAWMTTLRVSQELQSLTGQAVSTVMDTDAELSQLQGMNLIVVRTVTMNSILESLNGALPFPFEHEGEAPSLRWRHQTEVDSSVGIVQLASEENHGYVLVVSGLGGDGVAAAAEALLSGELGLDPGTTAALVREDVIEAYRNPYYCGMMFIDFPAMGWLENSILFGGPKEEVPEGDIVAAVISNYAPYIGMTGGAGTIRFETEFPFPLSGLRWQVDSADMESGTASFSNGRDRMTLTVGSSFQGIDKEHELACYSSPNAIKIVTRIASIRVLGVGRHISGDRDTHWDATGFIVLDVATIETGHIVELLPR